MTAPKILTGFYTHNKIRPKVLDLSLQSWLKAAKAANAIPIISSWKPITPTPDCLNLICHYKDNGHLNIILQILQIVYSCQQPWDYFAFCEHDCMYPETYFTEAQKILEGGMYTGIASQNHIGMRPNGWCNLKHHTEPLSTMIVAKEPLMQALEYKMKQCILTGQCCIEPDDRTKWFRRKRTSTTEPVVHINMDMTSNNHHLTNHYDVYEFESYAKHIPYWGNYLDYGVYTKEEVERLTQEKIKIGDMEIIQAIYGAGDSSVSFIESIRKISVGKRAFATNQEVGIDPAPGVLKKVRIQYIKNGKIETLEFNEGEEVKLGKGCGCKG